VENKLEFMDMDMLLPVSSTEKVPKRLLEAKKEEASLLALLLRLGRYIRLPGTNSSLLDSVKGVTTLASLLVVEDVFGALKSLLNTALGEV
jgi:hypothetical protein